MKMTSKNDQNILISIPEDAKVRVTEAIQDLYSTPLINSENTEICFISADREHAISKIKRLVYNAGVRSDIYEEIDFWLDQLK